jgi:hypothetical protein
MNATDKRRNREIARAIQTALAATGVACSEPDGWDDSLYATVATDEWSGELRISDHPQPAGGGWSEATGERHGESDIRVVAKSGLGGDLEFSQNGSIQRVGRVRVAYSDCVPNAVRAAVDHVVVAMATLYDRRAHAAQQAAETKAAQRRAANTVRLRAWFAEVRAEMARVGQLVDVTLNLDEMPRPDVPANSPNRKRRLREAEHRINEACNRLFAARRHR